MNLRLPLFALAALVLAGTAHAQPATFLPEALERISADSIQATVYRLAAFGTRHSLSDTVSDTRGIGAARRWIHSRMQAYSRASGGRLQVSYHRTTIGPGRRIPRPVEMVNVVAVLPGEQPASRERYIVVSGHYDSICGSQSDTECEAPGANDDASGTAVVMELARVLSQYRFDATLVFMAVSGEEQGLYGAEAWAEMAVRDSLHIQAMFTNDIVGRGTNAVRVFADGIPPLRENSLAIQAYLRTGGENDVPPRQLARHVVESARRWVPGTEVRMVYRRDRYLRGGDHIPFLNRGFAAVRFSEPDEDYTRQHQNVRTEDGVDYGDLPEHVNPVYMRRVAMVNGAAIATLALAPDEPRDVRMEIRNLTNNTTIRWAPNTEPDLAGYRIVWRETTAPHWQWSRDVGLVTEFTLEGLSKDNYLFGVQAVDRNGFVSPAVYPLP